ncbi:hypothetical protein NPIL_666641 [Nephila pilipes]|uniref:Uncharacterized protein n=1 Tax=Nephila pilipes TaxID=299642 RepID=A0A8X6NKB1_NEPPI|nr:hypothetical protein NPIL_666641 [Nephila pilipes]
MIGVSREFWLRTSGSTSQEKIDVVNILHPQAQEAPVIFRLMQCSGASDKKTLNADEKQETPIPTPRHVDLVGKAAATPLHRLLGKVPTNH